jgi:hypothetical protein
MPVSNMRHVVRAASVCKQHLVSLPSNAGNVHVLIGGHLMAPGLLRSHA